MIILAGRLVAGPPVPFRPGGGALQSRRSAAAEARRMPSVSASNNKHGPEIDGDRGYIVGVANPVLAYLRPACL